MLKYPCSSARSKDKDGTSRGLVVAGTERRWMVVGSLLLLGDVAAWFVLDHLGWHGFPEPPRVGEKAEAILERLGAPHYDGRRFGDAERDYQLGYTDGLGTRHHLHVKDGVVVEIKYSSR